MKKAWYTVYVFTMLNTKRFFRDRLAIFFGVLFPLIFLFVFGGISGGGNNLSFNVAVLNNATSQPATQLVNSVNGSKTFKVAKDVTDMADAQERMSRSQLDAIVIIPKDFGTVQAGRPSGNVTISYSPNNEQAGNAIATLVQNELLPFNAKLVDTDLPYKAIPQASNRSSLQAFDYTFAGLLGFSIIGLGIFGPVNVFPELKKQGILRRLRTTSLKVWQYFVSTMLSQAMIGLVSLSVMFIVAITVFHLHVVGNYVEIALFLILSIFLILGMGLAIGGWAKNERQAAPLSNIVVFPMLFLSGTFFPRFLMPEWLQHLSAFLPLTPVIDGIRLIITEGAHLSDLLPQLGLMAIWMAVIYFIAFKVFRWE
ncbi:MAG: type transporter [Candidatus Saccharibacteria bacterium]|nr:type transporter [Candidatus Saccharibacteria bacterium]